MRIWAWLRGTICGTCNGTGRSNGEICGTCDGKGGWD